MIATNMESSRTSLVVLSTGNLEVDEINMNNLTISAVKFLIVVRSITVASPE